MYSLSIFFCKNYTIARGMFDLVHIVTFTKLQTMNMKSFTFFLSWCSKLNLDWLESEVLMELELFMLNVSSAFQIYFIVIVIFFHFHATSNFYVKNLFWHNLNYSLQKTYLTPFWISITWWPTTNI